ncbi:hypothetical protein CU103_25700 [Phyllobacterium sophorae]|uniref:Transposase n=1 Tax=Phyllobacterium sophorae TaxID=1520277 RepID=A0A2P7B3A2_9HYPH|nr:hypothetical protein CU103_25700 [Phyllobacterium sophorae]
MARSGGRWRDLPERYCNYQTVKRPLYRLDQDGRSGWLVRAQGAVSVESTSFRASPRPWEDGGKGERTPRGLAAHATI